MRSLLRTLLLIPALWAAGAEQEPISVALAAARLPDPNLVLSPACVDRERKGRPIVCYANYGTEIILPGSGTRLPFKLVSEEERVFIEREGKRSELVPAGLGFAPLDTPLGVLAFPRAYFHEGAARVFCRSGVLQAGAVGLEPLSLYDDNLDGKFAPGGDAWCAGDLGRVAVFAPIGELMPTGRGVYRIEQLAADGSALRLAPFQGKTGRLHAELAAEGLQCRLALASEDGKCSFVLAAGPQAIQVPVARYRLVYGLLDRPASKRVAALIMPEEHPAIEVGADGHVGLALGQMLREGEAPDLVASYPFAALLELDLSAAEGACEAGDFAKAQNEFTRILEKHTGGPNRAATKPWIDNLRERLELESTPEAAELRRAKEAVLAAVQRGDLAQAKGLLAAVRTGLEKIPARLTTLPAFRFHKSRADALVRFAEGAARPGLKATYFSWGFREATGREVVATLDWSGSPGGGRTQFYGCHYEGFLVAPEEGEYELSLESDEGARLHLDGKPAIEHWGAHTLAEKSVRLRLAAGPHPLKIEYYQALGGAALHFRWTPPGGRRAIVPAWALEHEPREP